MITKEKVVKILEDIAVLLELAGENPFKSRPIPMPPRIWKKSSMILAI